MAEPITIKKKKLKIKSRASQAKAQATGDSTSGAAPALSAEPLPGVFGRPVEGVEVKSPSYTLYVVLAVLALLMFGGIIAIQATEWSFLSPAFPHPIQTGPMVAP
jgi:hypothetical protein